MNDKERLQRLKRLNNLSNVWKYLEQTTLYDGNALKESWEWLISQAEKVEQLQQENERLKKFLNWEQEEAHGLDEEVTFQLEQLKQAQAKAERYKQALEEILNADCNLEGLDAERELDRVTDIAFRVLEGKK